MDVKLHVQEAVEVVALVIAVVNVMVRVVALVDMAVREAVLGEPFFQYIANLMISN